MNKQKAFLRNYKYELIAFIVDVSAAIFVVKTTDQSTALIITLIIFILSAFIVIYFKSVDRDFYYYPFDVYGQEQDWAGNGNLRFIKDEKCFEITNSSVGFILPKTLNWDDYRYELDFKIAKISLGFIVRATNLSNYAMYQIFENRIKPHLRINGEWIIMDEIKLEQNLSFDKWYRMSVVCNKKNVAIKIFDQENKTKLLCDRLLLIPLSMKVNRQIDQAGKQIETYFIQNIDFDFGAIGIRNYGNEKALIKNIFVEKL